MQDENRCPQCNAPTQIETEGAKRWQVCDGCGWSKLVEDDIATARGVPRQQDQRSSQQKEGTSKDQVAAAESQLLKQLTFMFRLGGWAGILIGLVHLAFIFIDGYAAIRLGDALFNMLYGAIGLVCWKLLTVRKRVVMAVWVGGIIAAVIYGLAVGRGFNTVMVVIGALILGGFVVLSRRQELS